MLSRLILGVAVLGLASNVGAQPLSSDPNMPRGVAKIRIDAQALAAVVTSEMGRAFLGAVEFLPRIEDRSIFRHEIDQTVYSRSEAARLGEDQRRALIEISVDEDFYYTTRFGTPLTYLRVLQLYAALQKGGLPGLRVLDFGYGAIGHLRLMAQCGADVVGVDVDPLFMAIYSEPGDQGVIPGHGGPAGRIKLVQGRLPDIAAEIGGGYDLISSKNTLKNGFFHPAEPVPADQMIHLGVTDHVFVSAMHQALKKGGVFIIYNICPAPSKPGQEYKNWADGRCPFPRKMLEYVGFEVLDYNTNDDGPTRDLGRALRWATGQHAGELETGVFGSYTIAVKK